MYGVSTLVLCLLASAVNSQSTTTTGASASSSISSSSSNSSSSSLTSFNFASATTITDATASVPTGSYQSFTTQIIVSGSSSRPSNSSATRTTSSNSLLISGTIRPSNGTVTRTTSSATPTNTQPCNNYPEFCSRRYMNTTEVCAHNSAFVVKNNAASNQELTITQQLNDGIRMIQGETHWYNNDIYSCHTSCSILNAGTLQKELSTVAAWVEQHPYDVVTILLVNSDYRNVSDYVAPIQNSGLAPYLYEPPKIPMHINDWPTLGEMIITAKRVVIFMDYMANQTEVPYILDEFSQMWETPFSPTDPAFPCDQQRPPGLNAEQQNQIPYLANHNLNFEISLAGIDILIPAYGNLTQINAVSGNASAGAMMNTCVNQWNRPPAWLLVDYYNLGIWNGQNDTGAVFEVAARLNGVNYTRPCCGTTSAASTIVSSTKWLVASLAFSVLTAFFV